MTQNHLNKFAIEIKLEIKMSTTPDIIFTNNTVEVQAGAGSVITVRAYLTENRQNTAAFAGAALGTALPTFGATGLTFADFNFLT